jgi:hypothetical protein
MNSSSWIKLVAALFVALIGLWLRTGYPNLSWLTESSLPSFPDVDNGDGTTSYALVGRVFDGQRDRKYSVLTLRLSNKYKVTRPGAEGMSGSGGGVSFNVASNPNSSIYFHIKWPSFEDGSVEAEASRTIIPENRSVMLLAINESQDASLRIFTEKRFSDPDCKWKQMATPGFSEVGTGSDKRECPFNVGTILFVEDSKVLAELSCSDKRSNGCDYQSYFGDHRIHGYFAKELLPHFNEIRLRLIAFLQAAKVSNETHKL